MTIGERIKQRRIELNLTQDELAKKVGYKSRSSIQKIETARDLPLRKVAKMASALETSPGYLMGWEDSIVQYVDNSYEVNDPYFADSEGINKAKELYELYEKATPDVQQAVELILKSSQQKS